MGVETAVVEGPRVYIHLYDKWGNSVGAIELEPRVVEGLPERGTRKGELIFNTLDSAIYYWDGSAWRTFGIGPHTHVRADITDFWATPFWDNIPDKPSAFPPESHTHTISEITDISNASVAYADSAGDADTVDGEHASAFTHARNGGRNIWVQSSEPTALAVGDIWIQI